MKMKTKKKQVNKKRKESKYEKKKIIWKKFDV